MRIFRMGYFFDFYPEICNEYFANISLHSPFSDYFYIRSKAQSNHFNQKCMIEKIFTF